MIFSKQHLERAFNYVTPYFNKILLVNFNIDSFVPIKVMDTEWSQVVDKSSFTKWVKGFANSPMYKEINDPILYFADLEKLKELNKPKIILYEKIVNGEFHLVQLELYPIGEGQGYLFVRDLTKMTEGEIKNEE